MTSDAIDIDIDKSAITVTGTQQHEAWRSRAMPPVEQIAGGIWSIPVPFPDNPLRYTLTYLVPGKQGVVVVDPGWQSEDGWQALVDGLRTADIGIDDIVGIVATHVHADHHGLSGRLREASGAWVAMHPAERDSLPARIEQARSEPEGSRERVARLMRIAGTPESAINTFLEQFDKLDGPNVAELIEPDVLLEDGDSVPLPGRQLFALWTPGHTPGHVCLREPDARVLITGDHMLPRITPSVGLAPGAIGSPLPRFLNSLSRVAQYDDHEALPAHEYRFRGIAARSVQLQEHHFQRCREIAAAVDELGTPTIWQIAERITWSRPWAEVGRMQVAALVETMAHTTHLVEERELGWLSPGGLTGDVQPARLRRVRRTDSEERPIGEGLHR
ncbi:MAG: fold metallo-hydrolase [Nocardia sp.]|uniref:MBL fold metallo-hydrolase n=1 Tax=Nocardia sp. TaxID=1821 RepID=UPI002635CE6E|nr:MBL fold metallo-hydrolase [Nocardia sp.]MCU1644394.1 fold metallo-hydrolase [Nocardia sp.]